ncbi:MAG: hypothetical protein WBF24_05700 [Xanthobacteraceae bacterium]
MKRATHDLLPHQPFVVDIGRDLVGFGTLLSMLGPALVRRYVTLDQLTANNEIAGFKYAVLGVPMDRGVPSASAAARKALDAIYVALLQSNIAQSSGNPVMSEILYQLDQVTQARRARLIAAEGAVPGVIWLVLFGGAVITIVFTFFLGTQSLRVQIMLTGLLAMVIFGELLTVIPIDRPFTGPVKVEPTALIEVLADFQAGNGSH